MSVQDQSTSFFLLVFLQPVADVHYLWTALSLYISSFNANSSELFSRFFNEFGLTDAMKQLSCVVSQPQRFAGKFNASLKYDVDAPMQRRARLGCLLHRVKRAECRYTQRHHGDLEDANMRSNSHALMMHADRCASTVSHEA